MKVVKTLLTLMLLVGVLGGAAYGVGRLVSDHRGHPVASSTQLPESPTSSPTSPSSSPSSPSSSPTHHVPVVTDVLKPGVKGPRVRELQQRLFQLAWLPETTTGVYDAATASAVKGFQGKHGLRRTGVLDDRTWSRIKSMTNTPTHDAMYNVLHPGTALLRSGDTGKDVRALQARLRQIDWYFGDVTGSYDANTVAAVKGFQAKRLIPVTGDCRPAHPRPARRHDHHADDRRAAQQDPVSEQARPPLPDRTRDVHRQDHEHAALGRRRQGAPAARRPLRLDHQQHPDARGSVPRLPQGRATTCHSSSGRRCRTRCSSRAAKPCTTPRTSRRSATTARHTDA